MCKRVLVSRLLCVSPQAILSGAPVSLPPAELPPSYFHASQSIHACPVLLSRSLQQSSPQAISTLHSPSRLPGAPVSLPPAEILPSYFQAISKLSTPSALVPSFLPSLLVRLFCLAPLAAEEPKREPKHRRCFWEKWNGSLYPRGYN